VSTDPLAALRAQAAEALFPLEGSLVVEGLEAPVTVTRDHLGLPTIEAASLGDLWFAQGFVAAGERLAQIDLTLRSATGRLSELFGERTFEDDRFVRTVGLHLAGAAIAASWTEEDRAMHGRFRDGVRAWVDRAPAPPLEHRLLGIVPVLPEDPGAWGAAYAYLAWRLSNNLEQELLRAGVRARLGDDAVGVLVPPTAGRGGIGSNAWVVSGAHTESGSPLLANDPHLLALQPGVWLPMALRAPGYRARGLALTFGPGIVLGASDRHAWGATNVSGDVQDLFVVSEDDVTGIREEVITVLGETAPRIHPVRETRHGPVLERIPLGATGSVYADVPGMLALRWTGAETGIRPSTGVRLAAAPDAASFRAAVLEVTCPGQNFVYADVDGHIALQVTGRYPVRRHGDGTEPLPDHGWDGWLATEDLPWFVDPADGRIVSANDDAHAHGVPIGRDFHAPDRARRIHELLDAGEPHDAEAFAAMQRDTVSLAARATTPLLLERVPGATATLGGWDHDMAADSVPAAVWCAWTEAIARRALAGPMGPDLFAAYTASWETWRCLVLPGLLADPRGWIDDEMLRAAYADAIAELGEPLPAWGDLHRFTLAHPLAQIPGLEPLFVAVDAAAGGDDQTVAAAGTDGASGGRRAATIASARMVWDLARLDDPAAGLLLVPTGVSGNPASPHWRDQAGPYLTGERADPPTRWRPPTLTLAPPSSR
jgi:penicillin amidase